MSSELSIPPDAARKISILETEIDWDPAPIENASGESAQRLLEKALLSNASINAPIDNALYERTMKLIGKAIQDRASATNAPADVPTLGKIEDALGPIKTYSELLPIVQQARARLSFWSGITVEVKGYEGSLDIDRLAGKVSALYSKKATLDEKENQCRREIAPLIIQIYKESDKLYKASCCVTKIILFIRKIFLRIFCCHGIMHPYTPDTRVLWEYGIDQMKSDDIPSYLEKHRLWEACIKKYCS